MAHPVWAWYFQGQGTWYLSLPQLANNHSPKAPLSQSWMLSPTKCLKDRHFCPAMETNALEVRPEAELQTTIVNSLAGTMVSQTVLICSYVFQAQVSWSHHFWQSAGATNPPSAACVHGWAFARGHGPSNPDQRGHGCSPSLGQLRKQISTKQSWCEVRSIRKHVITIVELMLLLLIQNCTNGSGQFFLCSINTFLVVLSSSEVHRHVCGVCFIVTNEVPSSFCTQDREK